MSLPFAGQTFHFTQPDGSAITVRGWGNQHHARFETPEGYTVVQNPATRWWEVAQPSPDGMNLEPVPGMRSSADAASAGVPLSLRLRAERTRALARESALVMGGRRCEERRRERQTEARALRHLAARGAGVLAAPPRRGTVGDFLGLCLLVEFPDVPGSITRDEVERFCNQPGYSGFGNSGSVHDYFLDNSLGRCRYTNLVAPYYRAKKQRSYYTDESVEQPIRARELINEALAHWKAQGFDFSALTVDGSNYVYAMNVYYAGPTVNNWSKGLWPHAFHMGTPVPLAGAKRAMDYQFTNMGNELTLGTFCHENGHMLCDYPDLYDYGDESGGVGAWCLMCSGANVNPKNPTQIGGYLKRLSGWAANVATVEHDRQFSLKAGANEFALLAKDDKEYFLFEARHKTGRDAALPGQGLAIWHIDEEGSNNFEQMSPTRHYECSLEQADGQFEFERGGDAWGDTGDLFAGAVARFGDDTTPASRWWDGTPSQLVVDSISPAGLQMQFRCRLGGSTPPAVAQRFEATPDRSIPDNQAAGITETLKLPAGLVVDSLKVEVDITHSWPGDLVATLVPPVGAAIVAAQPSAGQRTAGAQAGAGRGCAACSGHIARPGGAGPLAAEGAGPGGRGSGPAGALGPGGDTGGRGGGCDRPAGAEGQRRRDRAGQPERRHHAQSAGHGQRHIGAGGGGRGHQPPLHWRPAREPGFTRRDRGGAARRHRRQCRRHRRHVHPGHHAGPGAVGRPAAGRQLDLEGGRPGGRGRGQAQSLGADAAPRSLTLKSAA